MEVKNGNYYPKEVREQLMQDLATAFSLQKWTLMCGTLLGAIRHNDYINWDNDIDIGVMRHERKYTIRALETLARKGYIISFSRLSPFTRAFGVREPKTGFHADIYELQALKNYYRYYFGVKHPITRHVNLMTDEHFTKEHPSDLKLIARKLINGYFVHYFPKSKFIPYLFRYTWVYIPADASKWLTLLYGDDWRIPNNHYSESKGRQKNMRRKKL